MTAPARWTAGAMQGMRSKAYLYNVTWNVPTSGGQQLGVPGTSIISTLFYTLRSDRRDICESPCKIKASRRVFTMECRLISNPLTRILDTGEDLVRASGTQLNWLAPCE